VIDALRALARRLGFGVSMFSPPQICAAPPRRDWSRS